MIRLTHPRGWATAELILASAALALGASLGAAGLRLARADSEEAACMANLRQIGAAIQRYRAEKHGLPPDLSALYPRYIRDKRVFRCPAAYRFAQTADQRAEAARVFSTYSYMYPFALRASRTPAGQRQPGDPVQMYYTWAQIYKLRGEKVPVVMCRLHDPYLTSHTERAAHPFIALVVRLDGEVEKSVRRIQDQPHRMLPWWNF